MKEEERKNFSVWNENNFLLVLSLFCAMDRIFKYSYIIQIYKEQHIAFYEIGNNVVIVFTFILYVDVESLYIMM